jgi:aminotransferase in exopolysaccharide biosynthesis
MFDQIIAFIREQYQQKEGRIFLHEPRFIGNEKEYLMECIDSTFVSSVGKFVDQFEEKIAEYTGCKKAVAVSNGTSALHIGLLLAGVERGDLVITQPLSFIATCNAISYAGADPIFVDVDEETLSLSANELAKFLESEVEIKEGKAIHRTTQRPISACVPMHTFGHPGEIDLIVELCEKYHIPVVEDAAEGMGSFYKGKHLGTFGKIGTLSFNGNKIITTGGGGMILTNDEELGKKAKHLTTQAKIPHRWEFRHDHIGYNYRLPNINSALGCAQLEVLPIYLERKRRLAKAYENFFADQTIQFVTEPADSIANYWLNAVMLKDRAERDEFLGYMNDHGIMVRPVWDLLNELNLFNGIEYGNLATAKNIADRLVNLPSSVTLNE